MSEASYSEIEQSKEYPKGVFHCSPYNSTTFTDCCNVAILEEPQCPRCKRYIVGWDSGMSTRETKRFKFAYGRSNKHY